MNSNPSFSDTTLVAVKAALEAGKMIREGLFSNFSIQKKNSDQNFATSIDIASEKLIISLIKKYYPDDAILAEESGYMEKKPNPSSIWIVDPLDGTNNFSRRLPIFVVSIALYIPPFLQSAVIYQPITNELFIAEKGKGAYLNGSPIHVTAVSSFSETMLGMGLHYSNKQELPQELRALNDFVNHGMILRNLGSGALTLAYVAAGKLDGAFFRNLNPWDIAAGQLLVQESGGVITNRQGTAFDVLHPSSIVATNSHLHKKIVQSLKELK
jgi:myo-inositol-1(or 4)-monophosphatase